MKVLVVGAGPSGLATLKELLDEGIDAQCVDAAESIGGAFAHGAGQGRVYDSTVLTVSNAFMVFSSFPHDLGDTRRYWTHWEYYDYLEQYARHFRLYDHIRFKIFVEDVRLTKTGVVASFREGERRWDEEFDAAAICSGTNQIAKLPEIRGIESFPGQVVHSHTYRNAEPYQGKRVLCVGIGETGADVAHEICRVGRETMLSIRHYPAIVERYPSGDPYPNDAYTSRALYSPGRSSMQWAILRRRTAILAKTQSPSEALLCEWLIRGGGLFGQWFTKSDVFLRDIVNGRLGVNMAGISHVEGDKVVFADGQTFAADVIMCNTGYRDVFPVTGIEFESVRHLYKHMIHPSIGKRVAFIGWARPDAGGAPTCSEMQARYWALLLSGKRDLPDSETLHRLTRKDREEEEAWFINTPKPASMVRYVYFCDSLARLIGCHPLDDGDIKDPKLLYHLWFGSLIAAQYRLVGPHANDDLARRTILRLPIAFPAGELVEIGVQAFVLRRFPQAGKWLDQFAGKQSKKIAEDYVRRHGGWAMLPDGGRIGRVSHFDK